MSAVINFAINLISLVIIAWLAVVFYFSVEDYAMSNNSCIVSNSAVNKANDKVMEWYAKAKALVTSNSSFSNIENFEERELSPHSFNYASGEPTAEPDAVEKYDDYNEILLSQLEPVVFEQHTQYVRENEGTTTGASTQVERSDREEVVPTWGLRRVKYGKDILSKNATTVPSFEYEDEKTTSTNLWDMIG